MSSPMPAKLAETDQMLELAPHEYALLKARRQYEAKGRSQRWIDLRLRAVHARQELIHEWSQRGATDSEQYRELTNVLISGVFGMDVQQLREFKHLHRPAPSLRDNMNEMDRTHSVPHRSQNQPFGAVCAQS
jgi:DNA-damage-inducible protein D